MNGSGLSCDILAVPSTAREAVVSRQFQAPRAVGEEQIRLTSIPGMRITRDCVFCQSKRILRNWLLRGLFEIARTATPTIPGDGWRLQQLKLAPGVALDSADFIRLQVLQLHLQNSLNNALARYLDVSGAFGFLFRTLVSRPRKLVEDGRCWSRLLRVLFI